MPNYIIPRIIGGIGNQLFSYAAARRLALVNDAELIIDDVTGFVRDHTYQREYQLDHFSIPCRKATLLERLEPFGRIRRYLKRRLNQRLPFDVRSYIVQEFIEFDSRLLHVRPNGTVYLEGYWQSEGYFKDVETTIRADLKLTPPNDEINSAMAEQIRQNLSVAVHVRFFGIEGQNTINNAPSDYYERSVKLMEAIVPGAHYFIFSDQPDLTRSCIPLPDSRITCVTHNQGDANAYADLWLMTQCQHFIIANSTFSWWGAWLAENPEKTVIAPGFELRQGVSWWGFDGLIPESWIKC